MSAARAARSAAVPLLHDPSIFPTAHFGSQALASLPAVWPPACILARPMPLQVSSPPRLHSGPRALVAAPTSVPGGMILLCPARFPRSQAFALPAICALASNMSLSSRLSLPRPSPAAASASGTPLPPSSSPPSHALFAGIPAAAAAVPEIPLRPPALNLCLSPRSGARPLGVPLPPTTPRRAPALARLLPAQIPPAPSHSVFPAHPARPRSPALATSASAPPSPRRLLSANKNLAHICASSLLHARVLVLCACECKFECECDCAWKNVRPTVP